MLHEVLVDVDIANDPPISRQMAQVAPSTGATGLIVALSAAYICCGNGAALPAVDAGAVVTCASDAAVHNGQVKWEIADSRQCASPPQILTATAAVGASCQQATDCAPTCCACKTGHNSTLAVACVGGTCAAPETVCCAFAMVGGAAPVEDGGLAACP